MDQKLLEQKLSIVNNKDFVLNLIAKLNINDNDKTIGVAYWNSPVVYYAIKKLYPDKKVYYIEDNEIAGMYGIPAEYSIYLNVEKEYFPNMNFDKIIMNPPFKKDLHLKVLNEAIKHKNDNGMLVSIQPARWIEDPLACYKQNSDYKKYKESIVDNISELEVLPAIQSSLVFGISFNSDLAIYTFSKNKNKINLYNKDFINSILNKVLNKSKENNLLMHVDKQMLDGWRCEVKEIVPISTYTDRNDAWIRLEANQISKINAVYFNGYDDNNKWWSETRAKGKFNKQVGDPFPWSVKFNSKEEATNFNLSIRGNFIFNFRQLITYDMHTPFKFIPYMGDYSHIWTDEDYCKFFNLTENESEFMCRQVNDYRLKDFINYTELK